MRRSAALLSATVLLLAATACSERTPGSSAPVPAAPAAAGSAPPVSPAPPAPASVQANELGSIPVLMYHQLSDHPASVYDRTPADFRAELERLARENYVPITAAQLTSGRIDIPAGAHAVVLTFDDSTNSQVHLDPKGDPTPDSALGILLDVSKAHPSFPARATFFVNSSPFSTSGSDKALGWLVKHGFEVGNHTLHHSNLATLDAAGVQEAIASEQAEITKAVPGTPVQSLALPYGVMPKPGSLAVHGSVNGVAYQHRGVYLVGSNPAPSPFDASFDPTAIPRIRSEAATGSEAEFGSTVWLDRLAKNPAGRYTSAGDPDHVTFPEAQAAHLAESLRSRARPY
ncbi:polysaccharide deacetylase family protein [Kitasatospora sp. NPDC056138]|uniref:polysaccharide deacetylase family protein n=1 Tax=Kitasatospora sp. NPDC056138 TaxID=3345724 RepID=UPI0035E1EA43